MRRLPTALVRFGDITVGAAMMAAALNHSPLLLPQAAFALLWVLGSQQGGRNARA